MDKKLENKYLERYYNISQSCLEDAIKDCEYLFGKKITDDIRPLVACTSGYVAGSLSNTIFIEDIYPMLKKLKKYFLIITISFLLLLLSLILVWSTISINSITILTFLVLPSITGLIVSSLKAYKIWSEAKKNLAEAKKNLAETRKIESQIQ